MKIKRSDDLKKVGKEGIKLLSPVRTRITVGAATCGMAKGAGKIIEALKYEVKKPDQLFQLEMAIVQNHR